jgi:hypothetical protein
MVVNYITNEYNLIAIEAVISVQAMLKIANLRKREMQIPHD